MKEEKMKISKEIIEKEIGEMKERYTELEKLFKEKEKIIRSDSITATIKEFLAIKISRKYPDLESKYPELKEYSDKTIYMFSVTKFPYNQNEIDKIFKETPPKSLGGKKISLCRINDSDKWEDVNSNKTVCLYVGSSEEIHQRLKEHLFECNPTTYAMHLDTWFEKKDLPITINIWDFSGFLKKDEDSNDEDSNSDYLQNIEDLLWNHYKPLFGRQGKK
jgi:hypothetical protein